MPGLRTLFTLSSHRRVLHSDHKAPLSGYGVTMIQLYEPGNYLTVEISGLPPKLQRLLGGFRSKQCWRRRGPRAPLADDRHNPYLE